jgi:hypothetical protein
MVAPTLDTIAIALADEGVPLRAIARVTKIPSSDLRERLAEAKDVGSILELPREDWPIGYPRDKRAIQLARRAPKRPTFEVTVRRLFGLSPVEVRLLLVMLQRDHLNKSAVAGMAGKTVDVHIHHLRRRLEPFGIGVETVWGCGYCMAPADRRRIMDMILRIV